MTQITLLPRPQSKAEQVADGAIHVLGVCAAIFAAVMLLIWTNEQALGLAIYGLTLIVTFTASAVYNLSNSEVWRPRLRRIDHAAIYLKIAGTYTPLVIMIGSFGAYLILAIVWAMAVFGVVRKLIYWRVPGRMGSVLYLIMGWLSLFIIWDMASVAPAKTIWLIVIGGLIYTLGVGFYLWQSLKFSKAIWHGFVVVASGCFYAAIALALHSNQL